MAIEIDKKDAARLVERFGTSGQLSLGAFVRMLQSDPDRF